MGIPITYQIRKSSFFLLWVVMVKIQSSWVIFSAKFTFQCFSVFLEPVFNDFLPSCYAGMLSFFIVLIPFTLVFTVLLRIFNRHRYSSYMGVVLDGLRANLINSYSWFNSRHPYHTIQILEHKLKVLIPRSVTKSPIFPFDFPSFWGILL